MWMGEDTVAPMGQARGETTITMLVVQAMEQKGAAVIMHAGGSAYGTILEPTDIGSGGGSSTGNGTKGGSGGGAIKLTVGGSLTLNGTITANGATGGSYSGGGSGGSIYLLLGTLTGSGTIAAKGGGSGNSSGGGGAGGRVALYYDANSFSGNVSASGSSGYTYGGAGTIYKKASSKANGDLVIDNGSNAGATFLSGTFDNIVVSGYTILRQEGAITASNLTLKTGATLTHPANNNSKVYTLDFTITNDLTIESGASINVDGRGYSSSNGPGKGGDNWNYAGGAGYGAEGGSSSGGAAAGGSAYGSILEPTDIGSGGGSATGNGTKGGSGGGAIKLTVGGSLILDGTITANGATGGSYSGGGSGGSIYLLLGTLTGSGTISAKGGGSGNSSGGGGAGGRIAPVLQCQFLQWPDSSLWRIGVYLRGTGNYL